MKEHTMTTAEHHHLIDKLALGNAILSGITLYPQLFVLLALDSDVENISVLSFALIVTNSLVWLWYGSHRKTYPLIISSFLNSVAAGAILVIILLK